MFSTVRKYFLDVWHLLLRDIDILFHSYQKFAYEAIMHIITRREFDLSHLALNGGRPGCAKVVIYKIPPRPASYPQSYQFNVCYAIRRI